MAFDVSALTDFVDESGELMAASIAKSRTLSLANINTGIKSAATINLVDVAATIAAGGSCSFSASGDDTFTQRTISVADVQSHKLYCMKDLEAKYTQMVLSDGVNYENDELPRIIVEKHMEGVMLKLENLAWQGDTASGNAELAITDGYNKIIDAAAGVSIPANSGVTAIDSTNIDDVIKETYEAIPEAVIDAPDLVWMVDPALFRAYRINTTDKNLFHVPAEGDEFDTIEYYSGKPMFSIQGLAGTGRIYVMRQSNLYWGTDLESDAERFEFWYSKDDRNHKSAVELKAGFQVAFPSEITKFISA